MMTPRSDNEGDHAQEKQHHGKSSSNSEKKIGTAAKPLPSL